MEPIQINVSDVMEYLFCPRFIYYQYCLTIPQHEEKRFKVLKGRELHESKTKFNKDYLRKKLGCTSREDEVFLSSEKYCIKGKVDQVLFLDDGSAAPFDYKFAKFHETLFKTHRFQLILYGLMIREIYNVPVNRGFVCYKRSNNLVQRVDFRESDFKKAIEAINDILEIMQKGIYPKKTSSSMKCVDCCYRRICV